jgi:hypothetical protein
MWRRRSRVNLVETDEMDAFLAWLDRLDDAQLMGLRAAWRSTSHRDHEKAWAAIRAVGRSQGLTREIDRVRDRVLAWSTHGNNMPAMSGLDRLVSDEIRPDAGEAIVDAALAVALGPRLDERTREVLMGPWLRVTEGEH